MQLVICEDTFASLFHTQLTVLSITHRICIAALAMMNHFLDELTFGRTHNYYLPNHLSMAWKLNCCCLPYAQMCKDFSLCCCLCKV